METARRIAARSQCPGAIPAVIVTVYASGFPGEGSVFSKDDAMTYRVFVDGQEGTTGLRIHEYLAARSDIEVLKIDPDKRKDPAERSRLLNAADVAFLCLPDAASREAAFMVNNPNTCLIDASTAHRTAPGWAFGLPELARGQRGAIQASKRIANPGCHASAFILAVRPLVDAGLLPRDAAVTATSITGYSGGGKGMIAEFEDTGSPAYTDVPYRIYGLELAHKHLPEIQKYAGLREARERPHARGLAALQDLEGEVRAVRAARDDDRVGERPADVDADERRKRRAPVEQGQIVAKASEPNEEWCIDFKGWFRALDGRRCDPLTISDTASRYLIETRIMATTTASVRAAMERIFAEVGMPDAIRCDNGSPFGSAGAGGASGYNNTEIGQVITLAYLDAFTKLVDQLGGLPAEGASAAAPQQSVSVTRPTRMYEGPSTQSKLVRPLDPGARLFPTGKQDGLMWEVKDELGNLGWVSSITFELAK